MRCFRMTIEYDGTEFSGFQYQVAQRTVQGELETAIERLTQRQLRVAGAGRTDAGVHAMGQVVSFSVDTRIPTDKLAAAMNSVLPVDVRAVAADETDERFHARFSARSRKYVYAILNRPAPSAILGRFTLHVPRDLDLEAMRDGAARLVRHGDFAAWANSVHEVDSTVREVTRCSVRRQGRFVLVTVEANAFLHGMVRNIVGTLLQVASGKRRPEDIDDITASRDRANAGPSAPARGLCLVRVSYP